MVLLGIYDASGFVVIAIVKFEGLHGVWDIHVAMIRFEGLDRVWDIHVAMMGACFNVTFIKTT